MPEGPQIKFTRDFLNQQFKNSTIETINFLDGKYLKKNPDNWNLIKELLPIKTTKLFCKGKFIWFEFDSNNDIFLSNTLGLSGSWSKTKNKYTKIEIIDSNDKKTYYNDKLNYGTLKVMNKMELDKKLKTLGLDIMDHRNTSDDYLNLLKNIKKKTNREIGKVLMEQKYTAGCGNYIRADALYLSKINPFKKIEEISDDDIRKLWTSLQQISFYDYSIEDGLNKNIFSEEEFLLINQSRIYNKKIDKLGNDIITEKMNDRTIHYCPNLQI